MTHGVAQVSVPSQPRADMGLPAQVSTIPGVSEAHLQAIAIARTLARPIRRATGVALFSGWSTAVFAGLTILGGIFSFPALLLGIGFMVCAIVELKGAAALRQFEVTAPKRLAWNQIVVCAMLTAYSAWSILEAVRGPNPYAEYLSAGGAVGDAVRPIADLHVTITVCFYGAVIACSIIAQGSAATYYATRTPHLKALLGQTPPWVIAMLRAAGG